MNPYEIGRQDKVDQIIHEMVNNLMPLQHWMRGGDLPWDIEFIGTIRDKILEYIQRYRPDVQDWEFYP